MVGMLDRTADRLKASFAEAREAITHHLTAGQEAEKILSKFLRENLPQGIGVTTGEVVDVNGARSRQLDVILYDAARTPMLFAGPSNDTHVVPAEGVLAVIEVKTTLRSSDLQGIVKNCRSVKTLTRAAYFEQPIQVSYRMYGREWTDAPIYYTVFAANSENLYAGQLNSLLVDVPTHERVDSVCCLDRGVNLWLDIDTTSRGVLSPSTTSSPRALPSGALSNIQTPRPLLMWYAMLTTSVMQTNVRPINISAYLAEELAYQATVPHGKFIEEVKERLLTKLADHQGIDPEVLRKLSTGQPLDLREHYQLMRAPNYRVEQSGPPDIVAAREAVHQLAQELSFEEWSASVGQQITPPPEATGESSSPPQTPP